MAGGTGMPTETTTTTGITADVARVEIASEVAGTVWKQVAKPGAELAAGDVVLILESMKMEIPVEAPVAGRLAELLVAPEDPVAEDQVVAILETA